jgi:hypothetical protein
MRIARVATEAGARVALVERDTLRLLTSPTDVLDLLRDPTVAEATDETVPLASARLLPPLAPPSVRDFLTFEQHVEGMVRLHDPPRNVHPRWYEAPTFYFSNPESQRSQRAKSKAGRKLTDEGLPAPASATCSTPSPPSPATGIRLAGHDVSFDQLAEHTSCSGEPFSCSTSTQAGCSQKPTAARSTDPAQKQRSDRLSSENFGLNALVVLPR